MSDRLTEMFALQEDLQRKHGYYFSDFMPYERRDYIKDMMLAAYAELGEALQEVNWKPWTEDDSAEPVRDLSAFIGELRDTWQFMMNMILATMPQATSEEIAQTFFDMYRRKLEVNHKRVETGENPKCSGCGRALDEPS